jgi:restriction endonuclease S subunit
VTMWPIVPLSEVLDLIEAGRSPRALDRPADGTELGVLKVSAISWGRFDPRQNKALMPNTDPNGCPRVGAGDLLMSRANTTDLVGAVVLVDRDFPNLLLSDKTLRLVPQSATVCPRFLLYALRTRHARDHIERCATGTSFSMRNISQEKIGLTPVPLPPLAEQQRIAKILDKADALRSTRRSALTQLDRLTAGIFAAMFGHDTNHWPIQTLAECAELIQIGPFGSLLHEEDYEAGGVPLVNPKALDRIRVVNLRAAVARSSSLRGTSGDGVPIASCPRATR